MDLFNGQYFISDKKILILITEHYPTYFLLGAFSTLGHYSHVCVWQFPRDRDVQVCGPSSCKMESSWFQSTAATVCGLSYETEAWAIFLTPLLLHTFLPVRGPAGMELAMAGCEGGGLNLNLGE